MAAAFLTKAWDRGRIVAKRNAAIATSAIALLIAVTSPPFDAVADESFSVHMLQHMVLMLVVAPLLAVAALGPQVAAVLPTRFRPGIRRLVRLWQANVTTAGFGVAATALFTAAVWSWHLPVFFDAALENPWLHLMEHAAFVVSAFLFWSTVFDRRAAPALTVGLLFVAMLQMGALGALLTLSDRVWYPDLAVESPIGLGPVEEQQLAGLLMWVPANFFFFAVLAMVVYRWIRTDEAQNRGPATSGTLTHQPR
jgi:cytochrome c oxidase assembly factor CtaG